MKKISILAIMTVLILSSFAATPLASSMSAPIAAKEPDQPLNYGVSSLVIDLDPQFAWDSASIDTIDQVCEGLFTYNLTDPNLEIIPRLASALGTWNAAATEYTVLLRDDVNFHDGLHFNASAIVWNFNRLQYLIENESSQLAESYEPLNSEFVINHIQVNNEYSVTFVLNYAYVPFVSLLCFSGSYMLSPKSTPESRFLSVDNDTIIGTGPFIYDFTNSTETHFIRNDYYYRGAAAIPSMHWIFYSDDVTKQQALLSGQIDLPDGIMSSYLDQYFTNEHIVVTTKRRSTSIGYCGMNNKLISKDFRQAISYAVNYTAIIKDIFDDQVARLNSPVPDCIMYHNPDVKAARFNVTKARQILVDAEVSQTLTMDSSDEDWIAIANSNHPLLSTNYTYNQASTLGTPYLVMNQTRENLKMIGIYVEDCGMKWPNYLKLLSGDFDKLQIYMIGFRPYYNDPSAYINALFSNTSSENSAQVNDPYLQNLINEGLRETDPVERKQLYYDMQKYIVEDLMPFISLYVQLVQTAHRDTIANLPINPMGKLQFYPITWCGVINSNVQQIPEQTLTTNPTSTSGAIPGYPMIFITGLCLIGLVFLKRRLK